MIIEISIWWLAAGVWATFVAGHMRGRQQRDQYQKALTERAKRVIAAAQKDRLAEK